MKLTENALSILKTRYLPHDKDGNVLETPEDMLHRVARVVASAESIYGKTEEEVKASEDEFYQIMENLDFLPNLPALINAGRPLGNLAACFAIDVGDSMHEIFKAVYDIAIIFKTGGGMGLSFSRLRPQGAYIKSSGGQSSGPVSFMEVFNATTGTIKQGSFRRGASLGLLRVDHPDIIDFITCKDDPTRFTNFNISVAITDAFMQAVEEDKDQPLIAPHTGETDGHIKARKLFDLIVNMAWKSGEPGIVFIDEVNRHNPTPHIAPITTVNACGEQPLLPYESCLAEGTRILTSEGWKNIENIKAEDSVGVNNNGLAAFAQVSNVIDNRLQNVFRLTTSSGYRINATCNHLFLTTEGWKRLDELNTGDKLILPAKEAYDQIAASYGNEYIKDELLGWIHGNGWTTENVVGIGFNSKDGDFDAKERLLPAFHNLFDTNYIKPMYDTPDRYQIQTSKTSAINKVKELGVTLGKSKDKTLPSYFWEANIISQTAFLKGLFTADGSVCGKQKSQISLASTSKKLLEDVQLALIRFGIHSNIYTSTFYNSRRNAQHKLAITNDNAVRFMSYIGFIGERKNKMFNWNTNKKYVSRGVTKVLSVLPLGKRRVFDLTVPNYHSFIANGLISHNCTLGSINLSNLAQDYPHPQVNYDRLRYLVHTAVRFLDNVIDVNIYPLPEIEKATKLTRKIGLGIMGLADMFIKMGIPYNSEQALVLAEKVMQFIQEESHRASRNLAKERGPFPSFEGSTWDTNSSAPIRNATTTTIAPTGTIAVLAGCSASIEPLFAVSYTRKMADDYQEMKEIHPLFQKVALARGFYSTKLIEDCSKIPSIQQVTQAPEDIRRLFLTSSDISPEWHVRMQAAIQKYVDNAASKTINLPESATPEEVKEIILLAHKLGCKGITVYRDGSRKGQAISTAESYRHHGPILPRPRPQITQGLTKKYNIGCGSLFITLNNDEHGPCEVFTNTGRKGGCPAQSEATARLISMALRSGIAIESITEQLRGIRCLSTVSQKHSSGIEVLSCPDAIGRVMEEIIKTSAELSAIDGKQPCPDCTSPLESDGGCVICRNCGYSKCG